MWEEDQNFEETLRSMAEELGRSVERALSRADIDHAAESFGVDPLEVRGWVDSASGWLRSRFEQLGEEMAARVGGQAPKEDPLRGARPHPLDAPTEEQGLALAALESGRWTVEPGSNTLAAHGEGPGPSDTLGLVRELRVRDWITADGALTLAGREALRRWLDAAQR